MCCEATRTPEPWLREGEKNINNRDPNRLLDLRFYSWIPIWTMVLEVCGMKIDPPISWSSWTSLTRCSEIPEFLLVAGLSGAMESWKVMKEVVNTLIWMRFCSIVGGGGGCFTAQRAADAKSHCSWIQRLTHVDLQQLEWMNAAACVERNGRAQEQDEQESAEVWK